MVNDSGRSHSHEKLAAFATFSTLVIFMLGVVFVNGTFQQVLVAAAGLLLSLLAWRIRKYWRNRMRMRTRIEATLLGVAVIIAVTMLVISSYHPIGKVGSRYDRLTPPSFTNIVDGASVHYYAMITGVGSPGPGGELWVYGTDPGNLVYALARVKRKAGSGDHFYACVQVGEKDSGGKEFSLMLVQVPLEMVHEVPSHKFLPELPSRLEEKVVQVVQVRRENGASSNC